MHGDQWLQTYKDIRLGPYDSYRSPLDENICEIDANDSVGGAHDKLSGNSPSRPSKIRVCAHSTLLMVSPQKTKRRQCW